MHLSGENSKFLSIKFFVISFFLILLFFLLDDLITKTISSIFSSLILFNVLSTCSSYITRLFSLIISFTSLYKYFKEHKENFYLQDISIVSGGERKIKIVTDNTEHNYMSLGGWIAFSPIYYEKLEKMNVDNLKDLCLLIDKYIYIW